MFFRKYVAMGLAALFVLSVLLLGWRMTAKPKPKVGSPLICAECGQKLPYEGAACGFCKYLKVVRVDRDTSNHADHTTLIRKLGMTSAFLGLLTIAAFWPEIRQLQKARRKAKEVFNVMNCGKCRRKLRYPVSSAGNRGLCPECGATLIFPGGPPRPRPETVEAAAQ